MYDTVQTCNTCGANLSLDDLRAPNCPYCKTVYPHKSMAEQQMQANQQIMGQMMGQGPMNHWQNPMNQQPMNPYQHHMYQMHEHAAHAQRTVGTMVIVSVVSSLVIALGVMLAVIL